MNSSTPTTSERPDLDEIVQQLDYLTADVNRIGRTLGRISRATTITAIASAITILGFALAIVLGLVGAFVATS